MKKYEQCMKSAKDALKAETNEESKEEVSE